MAKYLDKSQPILNFEKSASALAVGGRLLSRAGGAAKRVLFGTGQRGQAIDSLGHVLHPGGAPNFFSRANLKNLMRGDRGRQVFTERYRQGGVLGKGGFMSPWVTAREGAGRAVSQAWKAPGSAWSRAKGTAKAIGSGGYAGAGMGIGFTTAFPAMGAVESIRTGDPRHFTREVGTTLGLGLTGPFGIPATIAGSFAGARLGGKDPYKAPAPQRPETQYLTHSARRITEPHNWSPEEYEQGSSGSQHLRTRGSQLLAPHPNRGQK